MRRVLWNLWQSNGKLRNMKNRSFKVLCHKQIRNARRGSKEKSNMKHSWWQSCQPLLEHFLEFNLCMLYVVLKLRKSTIQCFKRYAIRSWNEGVTVIARRSLQAEGRMLHDCEISLWLRKCYPFAVKISQPFCTVQRNFSWSFSIFATDTFGYFASDFLCLNPHFLIVTHQL